MKNHLRIAASCGQKICLTSCFIFLAGLMPAQSLLNWSTAGNTVGSGDFIGSNNNEDLLIKTNGATAIKVKASGNVILKSLEGLGTGIVLFDNSGKLNPLVFSGNAAEVLKADGTFGILPGNFWLAGSGDKIYYTAGKVGIGTSSPNFRLDVAGDMRVTQDLYLQGALIMTEKIQTSKQMKAGSVLADSIIMDSAKAFYGQSQFKGEAVFREEMIVDGDAVFNGNVSVNGNFITMSALTFAGNQSISYVPATSSQPAAFRFGSGPGGIDPPVPDPCFLPSITTYQFPGMLQAGGFDLLGGSPNVLSMGFDGSNGVIDLAGNNPDGGPRLLMNYYCGKDILMCTGEAGGNVKMCLGENGGTVTMCTGGAPGNVLMCEGTGFVGIGTSTGFAGAKLTVAGNTLMDGSTFVNGNLGVGHTTPTAKVHVHNAIPGNSTSMRVTSFNDEGTGIQSEVLSDYHKALVVSKLSGGDNFVVYGDGHVFAREIKVTLGSVTHGDYVFEENYELMPLHELELYLKKNKHLPDIPSAKQVKENKGIYLGEMSELQLVKIEELSLYIIDLHKKLSNLNAVVKLQEQEIKALQKN